MDSQSWITLGLSLLVAYFLLRGFLGKTSPAEAKKLVAEGARLLDVRSDGEHRSGHIKGSLHIPVGELSSRLGELDDKSKPIVVYCASGMRSASAAGILRRAGFQSVHDLGAMARWPG